MMINQLALLAGLNPKVIFLFIILCIWETAWKAVALWKSGTHKQLAWFIFIFIFNTLGILPIIYLLFFQKKQRGNERRARRRRR